MESRGLTPPSRLLAPAMADEVTRPCAVAPIVADPESATGTDKLGVSLGLH